MKVSQIMQKVSMLQREADEIYAELYQSRNRGDSADIIAELQSQYNGAVSKLREFLDRDLVMGVTIP